MNNEYTRKERICPLIGELCNHDDKDCDRCIYEEEQWQIKQSREEVK